MSKLIDADKLKECDFGEYGYEMRYEIDRQPTVQAIPLDKVKQAREEIKNLEAQIQSYHNDNPMISQAEVLSILDKLIESEE